MIKSTYKVRSVEGGIGLIEQELQKGRKWAIFRTYNAAAIHYEFYYECLLAIHNDFLSRFQEEDQVRVLGMALSQVWGYSGFDLVAVDRGLLFRCRTGIREMVGWRVKCFDGGMLDRVLLELEEAERHLLTYRLDVYKSGGKGE